MADSVAIRENPMQQKTLRSPVVGVLFLINAHSCFTLHSLCHLLLFIFLNLLYLFFDRPAHPTLPTN